MQLRSKQTIGYGSFLALLFFLLLTSFIFFQIQRKKSKDDAYLVNISGTQRMLTQRIALLAYEAVTIDSSKWEVGILKDLDNRIKELEENHYALTTGNLANGLTYELSPELRAFYFGETNLDGELRTFLQLSKKVYFKFNLETTTVDDLIRDCEELVQLATSSGLLERLDQAVSIYEEEAENSINAFTAIQTAKFVTGLFLLTLSIFLIFRPLVNLAANTVEELELSNKELLEFSYRISHDIKAPIVSALGIVGVGKHALEDQDLETAKSSLDHVQSSMERLEGLVQDILTLTKNRMVEAVEEPTSLQKILQESLEELAHLPNRNRISIEVSEVPDIEFYARKSLIKQSLQNLLSNSIKYFDPKAKDSIIKIKVGFFGDKCEIQIQDNGLGIPKEYEKHLFQMFKRLHPKVSVGSGLGLYLVSQNAKLLGGKITYEGKNNWTTFKLTFPLKKQLS